MIGHHINGVPKSDIIPTPGRNPAGDERHFHSNVRREQDLNSAGAAGEPPAPGAEVTMHPSALAEIHTYPTANSRSFINFATSIPAQSQPVLEVTALGEGYPWKWLHEDQSEEEWGGGAHGSLTSIVASWLGGRFPSSSLALMYFFPHTMLQNSLHVTPISDHSPPTTSSTRHPSPLILSFIPPVPPPALLVILVFAYGRLFNLILHAQIIPLVAQCVQNIYLNEHIVLALLCVHWWNKMRFLTKCNPWAEIPGWNISCIRHPLMEAAEILTPGLD